MKKTQSATSNFLFDDLPINFNMFCLVVLNMILSYTNCTFVVAVQGKFPLFR